MNQISCVLAVDFKGKKWQILSFMKKKQMTSFGTYDDTPYVLNENISAQGTHFKSLVAVTIYWPVLKHTYRMSPGCKYIICLMENDAHGLFMKRESRLQLYEED